MAKIIVNNENKKSTIAPEIYEKWKKQIGSRREYAGYEKAYSYGKDKFQLCYGNGIPQRWMETDLSI